MSEQIITDEQDEQIEIIDLDTLSTAMRHMAALNAEADQVDELARIEAAHLRAWKEEREQAIANRRAWWENGIRAWLHNNSLRTISTPHGKAGFRKQPERLEILDEASLMAWISEQPEADELRRVRIDPDKAAIKKHIKETGEDVPGIELARAEDKLVIQT